MRTSLQAKRSLYETLTTPPPPKPAPKLPPFGPQHLIGAGVLGLGLWGITTLFIRKAKEQSARRLREAEQGVPPPGAVPATPFGPEQPAMAQVERTRGQYGP